MRSGVRFDVHQLGRFQSLAAPSFLAVIGLGRRLAMRSAERKAKQGPPGDGRRSGGRLTRRRS